LNKFGTEDPYYDVFEIEQQSFFGGRPTVKKVKKPKAVPVGISSNDERVLKKVLRRAYHLDMLFNIFGYRVGWTGLVGVVPVVGDIAGILFSLMLLKTANSVDGGLPLDVIAQFLFNIIIDFLIGLIPVVGDVVEIMYKANSRNALILEKHLKSKGEINLGIKSKPDTSRVLDDSKSVSSAAVSEDSDMDSSSHIKSPLKHRAKPKDNMELRDQLSVGKDPNRGEAVFRERTYSK